MVLELATVLLGAALGAVAVLYAAPKGYLGHPKKKGSNAAVAELESFSAPAEPEPQAPAPESPAAVESAPPTPAFSAFYENVQPTPAPVTFSATYSAPAATSFGAPSIAKKPTRTYRRRAAPSRSTSSSKASLKQKTKKR